MHAVVVVLHVIDTVVLYRSGMKGVQNINRSEDVMGQLEGVRYKQYRANYLLKGQINTMNNIIPAMIRI